MKLFIQAAHFAAVRHRDQKRKGELGEPYINHLLEVCHLLVGVGMEDEITLAAAVLHDTVEDAVVHFSELQSRFGDEVTALVRELTDDMRLHSDERKRLEVAHASTMSAAAQAIKVADKLSNVRAILTTPPTGWSVERRREYCEFAKRLVAHCDQAPPALIKHFEKTYNEVTRALNMSG